MKRHAIVSFLLLATLSTSFAQRVMPPGLIPIPPPRIEVADTAAKPMQVKAMSVAATLRGLQSTVETTLVFHNPNGRLLEGELVFPLPDGAAVCGYALDLNGALVDGVVVKKEQARVAFETETRRRVDPGLIEHVKGNLYRTRIYPLPANGTRTVRLTYTSPLATAPNGDAAFLLPLPREPIGKLTVKIEVAAENTPAPELGGLGDQRFARAENFWRVESTSETVTPGEDIWVALPKLPASLSSLEKAPDGTVWFLVSAIAPVPAEKAKPAPELIHVLWDASGSRAGAETSLDFALLTALPAQTHFRLTVFRDAPETPRDYATAEELVAALKSVAYDGGTDFGALASVLPTDGAPTLLFTDGIDTLSGAPVDFVRAKPIAVVSKLTADREALRQACSGALIDLQTLDIPTALRQILQPAPRVVGIKGTGIADLQGLGRPAVGRISVLGRLVAPAATVQIEYAGGVLSDPFALRADDAREGRTLATAWAAARVNQLSPRAEQFEDDLLALGRTYGLVSPATSLIVLESLDQWVRHEIEPPASLPELRTQWRQALKNRGQSETDARSRHLTQLAELWKERVAWWKTDFSKITLPTPAPKPPPQPMPMAEAGFAGVVAGEPLAAPAVTTPATPRRSPRPATTGEHFARYAGAPAAPASEMAVADQTLASAAKEKDGQDEGSPAAAIQIKEWNPDTPYLKAIRAAGSEKCYGAYLVERKAWAQSPAFFLDCADEFMKQKDAVLGLRILSNLAELRIEDAALLRVFAWRLRQAGELDRAIVLLRRVVKLRGEEPQSFRDLALVLADRGKASQSKADLEESMALFLRVALSPWNRHGDSTPVIALEELNALVAWIGRQAWKDGAKPTVPGYDEKLHDNLDTGIRIVMAWDADATDIDLHVVEPGGEEASYSHNRTARGGLVSPDVTDGYGPEEYLVRKAPQGPYAIKAHYYGSRQQTVVGPATVTATVFTDWGRATEKRQTLTMRLDKPNETVDIGAVTLGVAGATGVVRVPTDFAALRVGMGQKAVVEAVGEPGQREGAVWRYTFGPRTMSVQFDAQGQLLRVVELLPGGIENVLVQ